MREIMGGWWEDDEFVTCDVPEPAPEQIVATDRAITWLRDVEGTDEYTPPLRDCLEFSDEWTYIWFSETQATVLRSSRCPLGTFPILWRRVQQLASIAPAFVYDPEEPEGDGIVDVTLGADEAQHVYMWSE